ncbi:MAG: hypothetical protein KGI50_07685, partial [Patescibacteria group bacterium]|nr:hypothetical protein [Patescibacteria group bacterium]
MYHNVTGEWCNNSEADRMLVDPDYQSYMAHACWSCYLPSKAAAELLHNEMEHQIRTNWIYVFSIPNSTVSIVKSGHWA